MLTKRRRGLKGGPSPGVPPLRAAPAARSPCDAITQAVNERRAGVEPRPYEGLAERGEVGGGRTFGSSRTPSPTTGGRRPVRHVIYRESIPRLGGNVVRPAWTVRAGRRGRRPLRVAARPGHAPWNLPGAGRGVGNGENAATGGVLVSFSGRRGRRPLQGGCDATGPAVIQRPGGGGTPPLRWGRRQARVGAERPPPISAGAFLFVRFSHFFGKLTLISVPRSSDSRLMRPLWYWAACFTMDRPRPVPPVALEWLLSTR